MKLTRIGIIASLMVLLIGCSDSPPIPESSANGDNSLMLTRADNSESDVRLQFKSTEEVRQVLKALEEQETSISEQENTYNQASTYSLTPPIDPSITISGWRSLMTTMPGSDITYYECYGYDTLVPDRQMAKLLNYKGEIEVEKYVYKITPKGTYQFPKANEKECLDYIEKHPDDLGTQTSGDKSIINDKITLLHTFKQHNELYDVITVSGPNINPGTTISSEPDYDKFDTFSAKHHTFFGKLIENIIGATKKHNVSYSNKDFRLRGSFYFYDYFFVERIGVHGWTDKKNGLLWKKTPANELRVGWRNVIIRIKPKSSETAILSNLKAPIYQPPTKRIISGRDAMVAILMLPSLPTEMEKDLKEKNIDGIYDYLKKNYGTQLNALSHAEGCIIASPKTVYLLIQDDTIIEKDCKSISYVFAEEWIDFSTGYSNNTGFSLDGINLNTPKQNIGSLLNTVFKLFSTHSLTLIGGEVYICGNINNEWRGMRIIKTAT